ncbi:19690_t:CDS:2, partial [Gigaspora rosea]
MSFIDYQKTLMSVDRSFKTPWKTGDSDSSIKAISFAEKIAAKFDNKHITKKQITMTKPFKTKPSSTTKPYTRTRSKYKLTDLAKD